MRQKLGQHFLINPKVPEVMATALGIAPGDIVVEVGPGHGELTQAIVGAIERDRLNNVRVIAVERDSALAAGARQRFQTRSFLEVIEADILEFLKSPEAKALTAHGYKLAGNIPYYLTGHLLRIVGEREAQPSLATLLLQEEVAERIVAKPPRMNRLAATVQCWAKPKILMKVGREEFSPPPLVDSAVLLLKLEKTRALAAKASYYAMVRELFAQPRKTIANNLSGKDPKKRSVALSALESLSIRPDARPQDLNIQEIMRLSKLLPRMESLSRPDNGLYHAR